MRKRGREGREGGRRVHLQLDPTLLDMYCCTCSFMFAPVVSCIAAALGPSQCVARLGSPRAWAALLSGRAGEGEHVGGAMAGRMIYDYMHLAMLQHCLNSPLLQQQVHGADHIRCSALQRNLYMCVWMSVCAVAICGLSPSAAAEGNTYPRAHALTCII